MPTAFTADEEKILTALDAAAHDLLRTESSRSGQIAPCWLVCSDDVRAEYRRKITSIVTTQMGFLAVAADIPKVIEHSIPKHLVQAWRDAELNAKSERADNNPRAFFAG